MLEDVSDSMLAVIIPEVRHLCGPAAWMGVEQRLVLDSHFGRVGTAFVVRVRVAVSCR